MNVIACDATLAILDLRAGDWWVMATGACCAAACAVLGCFLVLRRLSLLGDAISHAVLPGLGVAFLVFKSREVGPMLLGAGVAGVLTAVLTGVLRRAGRVREDAAMGVVFTVMFALGVLVLVFAAREVDLDPGCVLYGVLEITALDTVGVLGVDVPRAFLSLGAVLLIDVALVTVFFKELRIVSFDPALATTMGISAVAVHYGLMVLVAGTTVASFEAVGSILVVAMLVAPGATAHLLTDRLGRMIWIAAALGVSSAVIGYLLALRLNTSVAGMMSVVAGAQFGIAVLLAPRYGIVAKAARQLELSLRISREDVLGMLYRVEEVGRRGSVGGPEVRAALRRPVLARLALWHLRWRGLVERLAQQRVGLSAAGREAASRIVRSHRLWEVYLTKYLGLPPDHVHEPSHRTEHYITSEMERELKEELRPESDPHGRQIPGV